MPCCRVAAGTPAPAPILGSPPAARSLAGPCAVIALPPGCRLLGPGWRIVITDYAVAERAARCVRWTLATPGRESVFSFFFTALVRCIGWMPVGQRRRHTFRD